MESSRVQGRSPRLLLAVDSLQVGGAERHVVDLAVALRRKGYEVEVACSVAGGLSEPLEEAGVPVLMYESNFADWRDMAETGVKERMVAFLESQGVAGISKGQF